MSRSLELVDRFLTPRRLGKLPIPTRVLGIKATLPIQDLHVLGIAATWQYKPCSQATETSDLVGCCAS
jgi:hypothetical protein